MGLKRRSVSRIQPLRLLRQLFRIALITDNIIGDGQSLCARGLRGNHLTGKGRRTAVALHQAGVLKRNRYVDDQDAVEPGIGRPCPCFQRVMGLPR